MLYTGKERDAETGFDFFYGFANTGIDYYTHERYGVPSMFRGNEPVKESGHATDLFRREALQFIADNKDRPFFLYLPFNAPHSASTFDRSAPQVPDRFLQMYSSGGNAQKASYPALVTQLDEAVGSVLSALRSSGLDDDTIVIFTSDNGGTVSVHNGPLRAGKAHLFEGGIRVPMIARWPGRIPAGRVSAEFLSTLEFLPTLAALAGSRTPRGVLLDGFDMLPVLEGRAKSPRRDFFWQQKSNKAARMGRWKWVEVKGGEGGLFDLAADLGETQDLSTERPDVLKDIRERWAGWRKAMDEAEPRGPFRDY